MRHLSHAKVNFIELYIVNISGATLFERAPPTYFLIDEYLLAFGNNLIYICIFVGNMAKGQISKRR